MAVIETTRPNTLGFLVGSPISRFVANLVNAAASWNDNRATRNALTKLSDRELEDIGLTRRDIHCITE